MLAVRRRPFPAEVSCALQVIPLLLAIEYRVRIGDVSFTLAELAMLLAAAAVILVGRNHRQRLPRLFTGLALIVAVTSFMSVLLQSDTKHTLSVYRDFNLPVLFYAAFLSLRLPSRRAMGLAKGLAVWATVSSVVAIAQFYGNDYLWFQTDETAIWQEYKVRLIAESGLGQFLGITQTLSVGLYSHPNNLGCYLVIPALVAYVLARSVSRRGSLLFWAFCALTQAAALVCTFSRSSFLTLLVGVIGCELLVLKRRMPKPSTIAVAVGLAGAVSLTIMNSEAFGFDDLGTLSGRGDMVQAGLALVMERPFSMITGGLTEAYMGSAQMFNQLVHNVFLYLVLQFGLPTTVAWTLIVTTEARKAVGVAREAGKLSRRVAGSILIGVVLTVFFYGQTASLLDSVQTGFWLFFSLGLSRHMLNVETADDAGQPADEGNRPPAPQRRSQAPMYVLPANG